MALREELERSGSWLFRRRSFIPLALFVPTIWELRDFGYPGGNQALDLACDACFLAIAFVGLAIRILTVGYASPGTSGRETRAPVAETLNTTGMYSLVRHPLYLGNYFMWLGVSLIPRSFWLPVVVTLAFWLYYERIIFAEEEFLRRKFGAGFERWAAETPAFWPKLSLWRAPELPFSVLTVLRREYSGFFAIVAAFTALELLSDYLAPGRARWDPLWIGFFLFGLAVYLTLRALKYRTRLLHAEGR